MNTTTSTVTAGVVVAAGRWAQNKPLTINIAIGTAGVALILALVAEADVKLAQGFGLLVLLGACFTYLPDLVTSLNLRGER